MDSMELLEKKKKVIELIKDVSNFFNAIRDDLCEPYGLSSLQAVILLDIYHHQGDTRVTSICKRLNKSTNTISPLINRMVDKNLLEKKKDHLDTRVTNIYFTPKTKEMVDKIQIDVFDYTIPYFESLTESEFDTILEGLSLIMKKVSE